MARGNRRSSLPTQDPLGFAQPTEPERVDPRPQQQGVVEQFPGEARKGALMEVFVKLEERIEKLIAAHKALQARVAELEEDNRKLRAAGEEGAELQGRLEELESERDDVRGRLEKVLERLATLEL